MPRFKNVQELLLSSATRFPNQVAFRHIAEGTAREFKYQDLPILSYQFAQSLNAYGLQKGDYLAIWADNSPEWVLSFLAALRLGAMVVLLDARSQASEIAHQLEDINPRLLLAGDRQYIEAVEHKFTHRLVSVNEIAQLGELPDLLHLPSPAAEDIAVIALTSGSSGTRKRVLLSHRNIVSNVLAVADALPLTAEDRLLSVRPLSEMLEFTCGFVTPLFRGATIVYCKSRSPSHLLQLLETESITVMIGDAWLAQSLLDQLDSKLEQLSRPKQAGIALSRLLVNERPSLGPMLLKSIHEQLGGRVNFWLIAGAPTSKDLIRALRSLGIRLNTAYSLVEASPVVSINTGTDTRPDSVGPPLKGVDVRIADGDEAGIGEILLRGPSITAGYLDNGHKTTGDLTDGWLRTGDIGYLDTNGHLHITDRVKPVIVTESGQRLIPEDVEAALKSSLYIKEACVFNSKEGGTVGAYAAIVPVASLTRADRDSTIAEAVAVQLDTLPGSPQLIGYQIWDDGLPRTAGGKILRTQVAQLFQTRKAVKSGKKRHVKQSNWDDTGRRICEIVAEVMDPEVLLGICPSGSRLFPRETTLHDDLALDAYARLQLAGRLESEFSVSITEGAIREAQTVEDLVVMVRRPLVLPPVAEASRSAPRLTIATRPWPERYGVASDWPLQDDPVVMAARMVLGILAKTSLRIFNDFKTSGADRLVIDPPFIVAANHKSHRDTLALLSSFPPSLLRLVYPAASASHFFSGPLRSALSAYLLNAVPFDSSEQLADNLRICEDLLRQGKILLVFPEERVSYDQELCRFTPSVAHLSITVGCPIVPAYIEGASDILDLSKLLSGLEPLKVLFGLPLYPPPGPSDPRSAHEMTARLRLAIEDLRAEHLSGLLNSPLQPAGS